MTEHEYIGAGLYILHLEYGWFRVMFDNCEPELMYRGQPILTSPGGIKGIATMAAKSSIHDFAAIVLKMRELQRTSHVLNPTAARNRAHLEVQVDAMCREILREPADERVPQTLDNCGEM